MILHNDCTFNPYSSAIPETGIPRPTGASDPDLTSLSSSDPSGAIAGTVVGVLIVLVLAGIIGLTVAVIVVRRRNKEYSVQQRGRSDGMTNPVYDGRSSVPEQTVGKFNFKGMVWHAHW